jgi:hypothetical protein
MIRAGAIERAMGGGDPQAEAARRLVLTSMRTDLRNLTSAMQVYATQHGAFPATFDLIRPAVASYLDRDVTIVITEADATGFTATATNRRLPGTACTTGYGLGRQTAVACRP